MTCREWSKKEIATLRKIMREGISLKKNMHLLPGRSYGAAGQICKAHGIKHASVEVRVLRVLSDNKPRTAKQLAIEIGASQTMVADTLRLVSRPGERQRVHACGFTAGGRPLLIYVNGKGINEVPRVPRLRPVEPLSDAALDRKYRASAAWWPHADPVVIASINAMVHAGRASA